MIGLDPHVGTGKVHAVELQPAEQGPSSTVKTDVESVWARQVGGLVQQPKRTRLGHRKHQRGKQQREQQEQRPQQQSGKQVSAIQRSAPSPKCKRHSSRSVSSGTAKSSRTRPTGEYHRMPTP